MSQGYIKEIDEAHRQGENDDRVFIAETKIIKDLAEKESCVIVGRCADYILKDNKDVLKIFLYSDDISKNERAVKYYGLDKNIAFKQINKINREREKHYQFYTNRAWKDTSNYDLMLNVDSKGIENTAEFIKEYLR